MGLHKIFVFFLAFVGLSLRDTSFQPCEQSDDCDPNNADSNARLLEGAGEGTMSADAELASEDELEAEDSADLQVLVVQPADHSFNQSFKARQSPGVKLEASVFGGVDATPATKKARRVLHGPMHLKRIADKDVSRASLSTVQYDWVKMIRGNKNYTVIFECSDENAKVTLPLAAIGLMPTLITVFLSCLMPGFLCGMCGKCGFHALETVPAGRDEETDDKTTSLVPRLKQSLLVRTTKHWWVQANPVLIFAAFFVKAVITSVLFDRRLGAASPAIAAMTAVHVALPLVSCLSSLAVLWGLQAAPRVAFTADTAHCPAEVQKSLQKEFATVSYFLGPRLGMLTLGCWLMPGVVYTMANTQQCFKPASAFAHVSFLAAAYLSNILASQFLLEAVIVARVAQAHVRTTRDSLDLKPDVDKLQTFHKACVRLVDEIMPELAKISGPTLGLAACRAVLSCFYILEVARNVARWEELRGKITVTALLMSIVIDMPVGIYCLLLPASVSDECAELMEHLNNVRAQEVPKELKAEVDRDSDADIPVFDWTVVDKRMILSIFAKFAAASSLLMTLLREVYSQEKEMEDVLMKLNSTAQRS